MGASYAVASHHAVNLHREPPGESVRTFAGPQLVRHLSPFLPRKGLGFQTQRESLMRLISAEYPHRDPT